MNTGWFRQYRLHRMSLILIAVSVLGFAAFQTVTRLSLDKAVGRTLTQVAQTNEQLGLKLQTYEDLAVQVQMQPGLYRQLQAVNNKTEDASSRLQMLRKLENDLENLMNVNQGVAMITLIPEKSMQLTVNSNKRYAAKEALVDRYWFREIWKADGKTVWLPVQEEGYFGIDRPVFAVGRVMKDVDRNTGYVLMIQIHAEVLQAQLNEKHLVQSGGVALTDAKGNSAFSMVFGTLSTPDVALLSAGRDQVYRFDWNDERWVMFSSPDPKTGWTLRLTVPESEISKEVDDVLFWTILIACGLVVAATIVVVVVQTFLLIRRMRKVNAQLEEWNARLEDKVNERTGKVRLLLDQSAQGFLTVGPDGIVDPEFSQACFELFGESPAGKSVTDLLWPDGSGGSAWIQDLIKDAFHMKSQGALIPYLELIPSEIERKGKMIGCTCRAISQGDQLVARLLFVLDDLTEKRKLEAQHQTDEQMMRMLVNVFTQPVVFKELIHGYRNFVLQDLFGAEAERGTSNPAEFYAYVFRMVHTYKGNFAQFGSTVLVPVLQQIESELTAYDPSETLWMDMAARIDWLAPLEDELNRLQSIVAMPWLESESEEITVDRRRLIAIREQVEHLERSPDRPRAVRGIIRELETLYHEPFRQLLQPLAGFAEQLAGRLEKWIAPVEIIGGEFCLDHSRWREWAKSLVHVIRNQLDHGIEDPDHRMDQEKEPHGTIRIRVEAVSADPLTGFRVLFSDDGAGINYQKLRSKLIEKGVVSLPESVLLTDDELNGYLFMDAVSTRDEANEWSGRGVGLAAVKAETEKLGGTILISSESGKGTEMRFTFPAVIAFEREKVNQ